MIDHHPDLPKDKDVRYRLLMKKDLRDGAVRPAAFCEPNSAYNERPAPIRVVNDRETRARGGY